VVLAASQLLLMAAIPFGAFMIVSVLPYWLHSRDANQSLLTRMGLDVIRALAAFLPATLLWGASFPLAVATVASDRRDSARLAGGVYSANTLGAILGTLIVSLFAVPLANGQFAQQMLTVCAGVSGIVMLLSCGRRNVSSVGAAACACFAAVAFVPEVPKGLLAYGRTVERWPTIRKFFFVGEGLDSPVVVSESAEGFRCFHVAGKVEATNSPTDMRTQRLLGHLPAIVHPEPRTVLVVGCGSGMTTGAFLLHPSVERIVLCEMESNVIRTARQYFAKENGGVLDDPRLEVVIDDARHFLAKTKEKFDIITADPIHPWVRGAASLYTAEFYELCRSRLTPSGVVTQWVPLYESNPAAVKCEMATFVQAFPRSSLWSGQNRSTGYDLVVVGTLGEQEISPRTIRRRLLSNPALQQSLAEAGIPGPSDLLNRFAGDAADLTDWLRGAEINRDRNLRLQYLAGLTPESQTAQAIFEAMIRRRPPIGLHAN
jgi:spermidine synthase